MKKKNAQLSWTIEKCEVRWHWDFRRHEIIKRSIITNAGDAEGGKEPPTLLVGIATPGHHCENHYRETHQALSRVISICFFLPHSKLRFLSLGIVWNTSFPRPLAGTHSVFARWVSVFPFSSLRAHCCHVTSPSTPGRLSLAGLSMRRPGLWQWLPVVSLASLGSLLRPFVHPTRRPSRPRTLWARFLYSGSPFSSSSLGIII